ncbi:DUF5333 domain-containing protein [Thalassorhabdomicrobium marinisediminis]|uniref:DUF5333 domain-containing protein n=1 Tax=Thalassorhabdomicrobium marinisediminis TaxID=2170577 RepID=UPI00248FD4D7|nr:DUF5333 domain-containing protein [Thalassorhabdomicrobium marinisediminis]
MKSLNLMAGAAALALTLSGAASANPANVERVTEGLIAAGMAIELGDKCDGVSVRLIRGYSFLNSLKSHLESLGYSDDEIDAYIDNKAEKERLIEIAYGRLAALGVDASNPSSYCAVAQDQMAQGTQVGRLLR